MGCVKTDFVKVCAALLRVDEQRFVSGFHSRVVSHKQLELLFSGFSFETDEYRKKVPEKYLQPISRHYSGCLVC